MESNFGSSLINSFASASKDWIIDFFAGIYKSASDAYAETKIEAKSRLQAFQHMLNDIAKKWNMDKWEDYYHSFTAALGTLDPPIDADSTISGVVAIYHSDYSKIYGDHPNAEVQYVVFFKELIISIARELWESPTIMQSLKLSEKDAEKAKATILKKIVEAIGKTAMKYTPVPKGESIRRRPAIIHRKKEGGSAETPKHSDESRELREEMRALREDMKELRDMIKELLKKRDDQS